MAYNTKSLVTGYRLPGQPISLEEMKTFLWGAATRDAGFLRQCPGLGDDRYSLLNRNACWGIGKTEPE